MKEILYKYIEDKFPNLRSEIYLRMELGAPHKNGTTERINQVVTRATTLLEGVMNPEDFIYVYMKDWDINEDIMFGNTTPEYVYDLLSKHSMEEETLFDLEEDYDDITGKTVEIKSEYKVKIVYAQLKSIAYKDILKGIGNYEQGREPSIGQSVYFISTEKDIIFHMYDDRGCDIFSINKDTLLPLYHKYSKWILDYNRVEIDRAFGKGLFHYYETSEEKEKRLKTNRLKIKQTNINLMQVNTCHISHVLVIPNEYASDCISEISETGFNIVIEDENGDYSTLKVTKTEALALVDYQTELMFLYSKKYQGDYKGWSVKKAF